MLCCVLGLVVISENALSYSVVLTIEYMHSIYDWPSFTTFLITHPLMQDQCIAITISSPLVLLVCVCAFVCVLGIGGVQLPRLSLIHI